MTKKEAIKALEKLEAIHCGEGAEDCIDGFPCLEDIILALKGKS